MAICSLKRFAADQADWEALPPPVVEAQKTENVAIVGSGPAGLTCAYHLALAGYQATIFEALPEAGGMLRVGIPEYRLPKDVLDQEIDYHPAPGGGTQYQLRHGPGFHHRRSRWTDGYQGRLSWGSAATWANPWGLPGGSRRRFAGRGIPARQNLGEPLTMGKRLAVIGGGNVAMDVACTARRLGVGGDHRLPPVPGRNARLCP